MSSRTNLHAREEQDSLPKNLTYVDYRRLKPLPITIPHNSTGRLYSKYQPYIHINEGCVPYPAVDSTGRISGGLAADQPGTNYALCGNSTGQVYVRSRAYKNRFAIMYSWFMPRDATWVQVIYNTAGHRFEWENAIIWLDRESNLKGDRLLGMSLSAHGGYAYVPFSDMKFKDDKRTNPLVLYGQPSNLFMNHQLMNGKTDVTSKRQRMVAWESMTERMRLVMNTPGAFGGCTSGIRDNDFTDFLKLAYEGSDAVNVP